MQLINGTLQALKLKYVTHTKCMYVGLFAFIAVSFTVIICSMFVISYVVKCVYCHFWQTTPSHIIGQLDKCIREASTLDGVLEFRHEHFWTVAFGMMVRIPS